MKSIKIIFALQVILFSAVVLPAAHIGFLMPSGGKQGSTVDVIVGGQAFAGTREAWISGTGVSVEKVEYVPGFPYLGGSQRNHVHKNLRNYHLQKPPIPLPENTEGWRKHAYYDKLFELSPTQRELLYQFLLLPKNPLQASPAIASRAIVTLKIAENAPAGVRELRLIARNGSLSNPLKFFIGKVPEYRENFMPFPPDKVKSVHITIPSAINGQILPGETDSFTFDAVKGEIITFKLRGRYFNAFIGDGVPGHFQAMLEVVDKNNKVAAYADDYFFDPDPVLTFTAPASGRYTLKVRDALYRGREDFIYRIDAFKGRHPLPDAVMPAIAGVKVKVMDNLKLSDPVEYPVVLKQTLSSPSGNSCTLKLAKNESVLLEVFARRLGLPPDSVIKVFDSKGKLLQFNDDFQRMKVGSVLQTAADSMLVFKAPADGIYTVNVSDIAQAHGEAYKYFLRIDRPRTRFAVYTVPSSLLLVGGTPNKITLVAERYDDFKGDIKIKVKSPAGFKITGSNIIPAGCSRVDLTLHAPFDKKRPIQELKLEASAGNFTTQVIPGNEAMQAFAYTHINIAETFPVRVMYQNRVWQWLKTPDVITLKAGKKITLNAGLLYGAYLPDRKLKLEAVELPGHLKIVPNTKNSGTTKTVKAAKGKRSYVKTPELQITLSADKDSAGKNAVVLFKVVWEETTRPDKNGNVKRYPQELLLPALCIKCN